MDIRIEATICKRCDDGLVKPGEMCGGCGFRAAVECDDTLHRIPAPPADSGIDWQPTGGPVDFDDLV